MREDGKQRRRLIGVINPALACCTPKFEKIPKSCTRDKGEECKAIICRRQDKKDTQSQREPGIRFVKCRGNEDQHQAEKRSEGDPVKNLE